MLFLEFMAHQKIHKPGAPFRAIVDSIRSVTYNLSKAEIIMVLLGLTEQHCSHSKQLATELKDIKIWQDEIFIWHDGLSLFKKTSTWATIQIVHGQTSLSFQDITQFLQFTSSLIIWTPHKPQSTSVYDIIWTHNKTTDHENRKLEEKHIKHALKLCQYLCWALMKLVE